MKTELFGDVTGDSWEDICQKLFPIKFKEDGYTEVPAKYEGDLGIEGFTGNGIVFQCYVPDETEVEGSLYEHQRNKITRDVNKLIKNIDKILEMIGLEAVDEWHFYIPYYDDKALIFHSRNKEKEIKKALNRKVSADFKIQLRTEKDLIPEAQYLIDSGQKRIPLSTAKIENTYEEILSSQDTIILRIKNKLTEISALANDQDRLGKLTKTIYTQYQYGQREYETLQTNYPRAFQKILRLKDSLEDRVEQKVGLGERAPNDLLDEIREEYKNQLEKEFGGKLEQALINCLLDEAIADWIVRCPIRF